MSDTDFLYPFIEADERDVDGLLADLASQRARRRCEECTACGRRRRPGVQTSSSAPPTPWRRAFRRGGRLFTFGNGGSATDARLAADRFGRTRTPSGELPRCA